MAAKKLTIRGFIWAVFLFLSSYSWASARQGHISYRGEKEIELVGEWEFYWDTIFTSSSNTFEKPINFIKVPSYWNEDYKNQKKFPSFGSATYRLIIDSDKNYPHLSILIPEIHSSYELYLNGHFIIGNGKVADHKKYYTPQWLPLIKGLSLQKGKNELICRVANFDHCRSGMHKSLCMGTERYIQNKREIQIQIDMFLIGSLAIIGLFFLGLHIFWRKDISVLYFAILTLLFCIRIGSCDLHLINNALHEWNWEVLLRIEYLSLFGSLLCWGIFLHSLFPKEYSRTLNLIFNLIYGSIILCILITPPSFFTHLMRPGLGIMVIFIAHSVYVLIKARIHRQTGSLYSIISMFIILSAALLSTLYYFRIVPYMPFIENLAYISAVLCQAFALALRFALSFNHLQELQTRTSEQNKLIEEALAEKEVLMKEIHHRVKNNLQIINSLLFLQSKKIKDRNALEAIKDNQFRVHSIALVHQKLYQSEDNNLGVNMKEYLDDLLKKIYQSVNMGTDIQIIKEVEDIILDLDSAIPIGLIINELIVNAIKYAFRGIENPGLLIKLYKEDDAVKLLIKDNGCGLPSEVNYQKPDSFGLSLVYSFSRKLKTIPKIHSSNLGTSFFFAIQPTNLILK